MMVLAREPGQPEGDDEVAYIFVVPIDADGRIDPNYGNNIASPAGSRGNVQTNKTRSAISFISRGKLAVPL